MERTRTRINLTIPLDLAILIDKECERLSVTPTQFLRGAAYEKIKRIDSHKQTEKLDVIENDIKELKIQINSIVNLLSK